MANDRIRIEVQGDSSDLQAALARSRESIKGVGDESDRQTTRAGRSFDRLRAKLAKPISAKVEAETAAADAHLNDLGAKIKALDKAKASMTVDADVAKAESKLRALRAEMRRTADAANIRAEARVDVQGLGMLELLRARLRSFGRENATASVGVSRLNTSVGGLNGKFQLLRNGMRLLRWPLIATGAGIATQALSAATAGATGLLGALGPLSGTLVAIPTAMGAAAQGMGVWRLATGGLMEAVGGLNEKLDKSSKAWKALSPEGQRFAQTLQRLKAPLRDIQQTAQRGLFPGLREGLRDAMRNLPVVERLVGRTAKALGGMAARAGKALGSAEWGRDIETIGTRNVRIMTTLGDAAGNVANALRHVAVAAGPAMEGLVKDVTQLTDRLEKAAEAGRKSGRLGAFFDRARERAHKVAGILGNVASGLLRILTLGNKHMGGPLLDDLAKVSKRFNEWTKSARGQNAIATYFKRARPAVSELGRTLAEAGKAFLRIGQTPGLEKTLKTVRTRLIPALEKMLTTMAGVAGPEVVNALASIAELFAAMSPYVAEVAKFVAGAVGGLADLVRKEPAVGYLVASVLALGAAFKVLKFTGIIGGLKGVIKFAKWARTAMAGVAVAEAGAGVAGGAAAGAGGAAAGGGAMAFLKRWGGRLIKFAGSKVILPVGILVGLLELGQATGVTAWFRKNIDGPLQRHGRRTGVKIKFLAVKAGTLWKDAKKRWGKRIDFVARKAGELWRSAKNRVRKGIAFVAQKAGELWRSAKDVWKKAIRFAAETAGDLWRKAKDTWKKAIKFVAGAVGGLWRDAKQTWDKSIRFVAWAVGGLWRTAGQTITKFVRFVSGRAEGGPVLGGFAGGGTPTPTDAFAGAPTRKSMGGRHSRPTYLVGEENRPEFVIATNPAYRKANLEYLSMAAAALKAPMVPAFAGGGYQSGVIPGSAADSGRGGGSHNPASPPRGAQVFEDGSWRLGARPSGMAGGGSKFLSFSVSAGFAKGGTVDAFAKGGRTKRRGTWTVNPAWMRWLSGRVGGAAREPDENAVASAERAFSMWQSRYDLSEEEFVRDGRLNQPHITRRARELDSLIGKAQGIVQALQRRSRGAGRNLDTLAWGRRKLGSAFRDAGRWRHAATDPLKGRDEEYREAAKRWRDIRSSSPFDIFEAQTNLMGLRQERAKLRGSNWPALLAESGGGGGGASGDDGYQQRQIERLMAELQTARVERGQLGVVSDFAAQYVGRYAQGGPISLPRSFGSSGIAEVHRGERVVPDPRGGYGSQVAMAGQGGPVKVDVTIGFDDRGMLKIVDQRIDGRAADVSSREIGRRTRRIASAPGARRPTYAR